MSVIHTFLTQQGGTFSVDLKGIEFTAFDGNQGYVRLRSGERITFDKPNMERFYELRDKWLASNGYDPETHLKNAIQESKEQNPAQ